MVENPEKKKKKKKKNKKKKKETMGSEPGCDGKASSERILSKRSSIGICIRMA